MIFLKWLLLTAGVFLVHTQLSSFAGLFNLSVVLVYYFGVESLSRISSKKFFPVRIELESAGFGASIGLVEDALSGGIIGPAILSRGLIGFVTPFVYTEIVFRWTPIWAGALLVLFTFCDGWIIAGARSVFSETVINNAQVLRVVAFQCLVSLPFALLIKPLSARSA
ncbi:MAG: hypothetical protein EPN22_01615 [Nitrospirae bacterium]|nr:MAG: hypothetical protein EPN22_01615 [Nitrospirota bacterium]